MFKIKVDGWMDAQGTPGHEINIFTSGQRTNAQDQPENDSFEPTILQVHKIRFGLECHYRIKTINKPPPPTF